MRTLTLTLALFGAGLSTANAQQFLLQAGSGATLVGDTFFVQPGQNFTVRTILDMQGTTASTNFIATALAYSIGGALDSKLTFLSGEVSAQYNSDFPTALTNPAFLVRNAAVANPANYSSAAGQLPRVVYNVRGITPGNPIQLVGSRTINDITFSNNLSAGEVYGDTANETGLFLASQIQNGSGPQLGSSGIDTFRFGSPKYKVQAVPEPATLTCIAFGVAALLRRRKGA